MHIEAIKGEHEHNQNRRAYFAIYSVKTHSSFLCRIGLCLRRFILAPALFAARGRCALFAGARDISAATVDVFVCPTHNLSLQTSAFLTLYFSPHERAAENGSFSSARLQTLTRDFEQDHTFSRLAASAHRRSWAEAVESPCTHSIMKR